MKNTQIMSFENPLLGEVRGFIDEHGELWFLAGQVCRCLKLDNSSVVVKRIKDKHGKFGDKVDGVSVRYLTLEDNLGRKQKTTVVNEAILYEMIFYSNTEKAFKFQQWVLKEVLPELRKHGFYRIQGKLIRRSLTDTLKDTGENKRMHGHSYSTYSVRINKSLGLPNKVNRDELEPEMLEKIARREDTIRSLVAEGKQYTEIKSFIENNFVV